MRDLVIMPPRKCRLAATGKIVFDPGKALIRLLLQVFQSRDAVWDGKLFGAGAALKRSERRGPIMKHGDCPADHPGR